VLGLEGLQLLCGGRHDLVRGGDILLRPVRVSMELGQWSTHTYGSLLMRDCRTCRWYSMLFGLPFSGEVGLSCALVSRALSTLEDIVAGNLMRSGIY
jgi:hypothetical protein